MSRPQPDEKTVDERDPRDVRRLVVIVLTASAALWVASVWDISWQTTFESGTFWSPPHVVSLLLAGAVYAVAHPWTAWPPAPRAGISTPVVTGCRLIAIEDHLNLRHRSAVYVDDLPMKTYCCENLRCSPCTQREDIHRTPKIL